MTPIDGCRHIDGSAVHWRFGWVETVERAALSLLARRWVEDLVRERDLFPWSGIGAAESGRKPRFADGPDADFSISHSGRAVMVAVATGVGVGVGVDVEAAPFRAFDSDALLRRMCSPREAELARAVSGVERPGHLAQLWTAKEAAVKASGRGLAHDFRTFEFDLPPHTPDLSAIAHLALTDGRRTTVSRVEILTDRVETSAGRPTSSRPAAQPLLTP